MMFNNTLLYFFLMLFSSAIYAEVLLKPDDTIEQLIDLSIEDLMNVEVISVTRKKQKLSDSAAAVYVISQEDIRRSGHQNIPEILRMVPGLHVAHIDSSKWAISSRGSNGRFANKLLILMDGRTLYSPLYSGVYWDVQGMVLEDIERIEVIRGPGAALWGANAVNGVINIISKSTSDTKSGLLRIGTGSDEKYASVLRYGGDLDAKSSYRIYAKSFQRRGGTFFDDKYDTKVHDDWDNDQFGFKVESQLTSSDSITLQGDWYNGSAEQNIYQVSRRSAHIIDDEVETQGANLIANWEHRWSDDAGMDLKIYFDRTRRKNITLEEKRETFDIDFQNDLVWNNQQIVWGLGYQQSADDMEKPINSVLTFIPENRKVKTYSAFIQDDISFYDDRLHLIIGSKYEHNDYTGYEVQPNARLSWSPNESNMIWAAVSKAIRTPSRLESDVEINTGGAVTVRGNSDFDAEKLLAYELGYRFFPKSHLFVDIAAFINHYDELRTIEMIGSPIPPIDMVFDNKMDGKTYGLEVMLNWEISQDWRLNSSYSWLHADYHIDSDSIDTNAVDSIDTSPEHQFQLHSYWNLNKDFELDAALYYVGESDKIDIDSYTRFDLRLGWQWNKNLTASVAIQNLFDSQHQEFSEFSGLSNAGPQGLVSTEVERNIHLKLIWQF